MKSELDNWYLQQPEPTKSCLLALRTIVLQHSEDITEAWKYRMPFFCCYGRMFCYLWIKKKSGKPYMGFVDGNLMDHPKLVQQERSRMKVLFIDVNKDLPIKIIHDLLQKGMKIKKESTGKKKKS